MPRTRSATNNTLSPIYRTEVEQPVSDHADGPCQRVKVTTDGARFPEADWATPDEVAELADLHAAEVHLAEQVPVVRRAAAVIAASMQSPKEVGWHHAELILATEFAKELWGRMGTEGLDDFCRTVESKVQARRAAVGCRSGR